VRDDDEQSELGSAAVDSAAADSSTQDDRADPGGAAEPRAESATEPLVEPTGSAAANHSGPKLLRELHGRDRWLRILAIAFTIYHLAAMLVGGSVSGVRRAFKPLTGFYSEGLRMTNGWGMFARPPTVTHVVIEGTMSDGTKKVLSTTRAGDRNAFERIRDVRIRKIQGKLGEPGDRAQLGHAFLDYYCRRGRSEQGPELLRVRIVGLVHELRDDDDNVTRKASELSLLTRSCREPMPAKLKRPAFMEKLVGPRRTPSTKSVPSEGGDL
jgi:hypothetical protein